jgi:hypothetical protein
MVQATTTALPTEPHPTQNNTIVMEKKETAYGKNVCLAFYYLFIFFYLIFEQRKSSFFFIYAMNARLPSAKWAIKIKL